jgi:chemotaxis protein methyltransferase CheR
MAEQVATKAPKEQLASLSLRREELVDIELQLLLDALLRYATCDFRAVNPSVLRRRVADAMRAEGVATISGLQERLLHDERALASFVVSIKPTTAAPFADPAFFRAFSANVIPLLRTYAFVRIWLPSGGPGADPYALAAILEEAGILERTILYATFLNEVSVSVAKAGGYRHTGRASLESSARMAGLQRPLADHFEIDEEFITPKRRLRENVMLARHNPACDTSINEFHAIVSRGFLSLLNGEAQYALHSLFYESLMHLGFLALGGGENISHSAHERAYRQVVADQPIFRRMR